MFSSRRLHTRCALVTGDQTCALPIYSPGVSVERKSGRLPLSDGRPVELVDLPGTYSLDAASPDEQVTRDVVLGRQAGERQPDVLVVVLDAANLDNHLRFALELIALGLPVVVALNMVDQIGRAHV